MEGTMDIGFRWIDDITIEFDDEMPDAKLQLKIKVAGTEKKYKVRSNNAKTICRVSNERITNEVGIELYEYRRKHRGFKEEKVRILSAKISLKDDELYTEEAYRCDDDTATIKLSFAYTPGGELRDLVEKARRITAEQRVVLDKIRHVHRFFEELDVICNTVKDIHAYIEGACNALLLLYKLCEKQKSCRDSAQGLVDEMDDLLNYGVESLGSMLKENSNTKIAFKSVADVITDITKLIVEEDKGIVEGLFRDAFSTRYESKLGELREKFRRAKEGLRDSIALGTWERMIDVDLRAKLESVSRAHYSSGEGCLEGTRKALLTYVDTWLRGPSSENTAWVYGHAGSGKSALLNSIAESLENTGILFTYFPCKRDDPELSDIHRILPTLAYCLSEYYGDYRGALSDIVKKPSGRSILTGDVKKQMELLFGNLYDLISPSGAKRPSVHAILVEAIDESRNHRDEGKTSTERRTLLEFLLDFANNVSWIKVIITSRREPDTDKVLGGASSGVNRIDINDAKWGTDSDIRAFIEAKSVEMDFNLTSNQIQQLVKKAAGLFIWCATVFRYIEKRRSPGMDTIDAILSSESSSQAKDKPLESLYGLYQRVLDSAASDNEDKALVETVLGVIFVASTRQPLSADAIAEILYPNEHGGGCIRKKEWVKNVIVHLFAILYIEDGTGLVRTCHPSVLDFSGGMLAGDLPVASTISRESSVKSFSVGIREIHALVARGCLIIMNYDLRFNVCDLEDSSQLNEDVLDLYTRISQKLSEALRYGSVFWVSHLVQSGLRESIEQVLAFLNSCKALFWVEALSLLGVVDRGIVALQDCAQFFVAEPSVADIACEWERFLLAYGDALKSTPHLYLSALSWLPRDSRLWDIAFGTFSSGLPMVSNVQKAWNHERWSERVGTDVWSVAYSPDGRLFAAGCWDGGIRFWDARSGRVSRESFMTESGVLSIAFSPDNHLLASGHFDGSFRLWDLRSDQAVPRLLEGHTRSVYSVAFSSTGRQLVSSSGNTSIKVWDVESGTSFRIPIRGHGYRVTSVTFSADDTRIVSASLDGTVRIWNVEKGQQIGKSLQDHFGQVFSVACSRDGRFIASGTNDGTLRLWSAQTYEQIGTLCTGPTSSVTLVCFSADSNYVMSGSSDHAICIWSVEPCSLICELRGHTDEVKSAVFSPDGQSILSGSSDGTVRVWDVKEIAATNQLSTGNSAEVFCVSYIPQSNLIVSGSSDFHIYRWDAQTGTAFGKPMHGHTDDVNTLAVSGDGRWIVSGSDDKTLRIWDIATGTSLGGPLFGHSNNINSVAISPDSCLVASASDDNTVCLWDVATRNLLMSLEGHEDGVISVVFSVDGNSVISGSRDYTIRIWDAHTGMAVGEPLRGHSEWVTAVAVSPDGHWLASASFESARIWCMTTLSEIHVLEGHAEWVTCITFSLDGRYLVSGSWDNTIRIWGVQTGEAIGSPLVGHTDMVNYLAFGTNGNEFASASSDGTIRIWDMRSRTDLELLWKEELDYTELDEEELRARWNASRACMNFEYDGWVRDGERLLLWVPLQYRRDINGGARLVIDGQGANALRPVVDHRKVFRYSGARWKDIFTAYQRES